MNMKMRLATLRERAHAALQHRRTWVVLTLLAVFVAIATPFWAAHHLADTVSVTVTITGQPGANTVGASDPNGEVIMREVYFKRLHDSGTAREVQSLLADSRVITPFSGFGCDGPSGSTIEYDFHFSFLGIPVQEAHMAGGCIPLQLTTLGVMSPLHHYPPDRGAWQRIEQLLGIPDPSTWYAK